MDIWKHGTYVDTWSLVHLFSGILLSGVFFILGYSFTVALIGSFVLILAWEVFEWVVDIIEPSMNVFVDILVGLVGFFIGSYFYFKVGVPFNFTFFTLLILTVSLAAWGFLDYRKRGYR